MLATLGALMALVVLTVLGALEKRFDRVRKQDAEGDHRSS
jgi:hypothetical protein